ncbi:MAG: hypothetical protein KQH79_01670 [Bacteroidetes bacterium]|nr:hypothetical protein [Bacteroidota bacterium]
MDTKKSKTKFAISLIVTIITAFLFSFLFLYLGINHRRDVYNDSKILAAEISRNAAFETQVYIWDAISTAKTLEQKAQLLKRLNGSREDIREILVAAIKRNKNYLGVWTLWEPNAFDDNDLYYKADSNFNASGRLGIGFFRYSDSIYYEVMTTKDYEGDYFVYPKKLKSEYLTEPYKFVYSGHNQLFFGTTVSVPIIYKSEFLGAIGVDIDLRSLQNNLNKIRPYDTGYLSLIANNGTIISHIDTTIIEKNILNFLDQSDTLSHRAILNGSEYIFEKTSEFTGERVFRMFYPISITKDNRPWSMMIEIPVKKVTKRSMQLLSIAFVTLFVGISLLMYLIFSIIERRRYEKDLENAKLKAEESDRLKSAFLNNISHEIRTPLNGILGFTVLLTENKTTKEEAKSYKSIIQRSSNQLLSIITNVIELSKIQSGQSQLNIKRFNVKNTIEKVIETFRLSANEKKINIHSSFPDHKKKYVISSDQHKFTQVLSYLLENAIKFTQSGYIEIGFTRKDEIYTFYIKDTGIGMNQKTVRNIFNYFSQGDSSTIRNYGGLGVGLSISKSFVDMLQGSIYLDSEEGKGTTFYFTLQDIN